MSAGKAGRPAVGKFSPIWAPTVLPGPPLGVPLAMESAEIEPIGKEEFGNRPTEKLLKAPLPPTRPPTTLLVPEATLPDDVVRSINPKFRPATPPAKFCEPVPVT